MARKKVEKNKEEEIINAVEKSSLEKIEDFKSKESENSGEKEIKISEKRKQNKQIIWAVVLMVGILIVFFVIPYAIKNKLNTFEYAGIEFQKTKLGKIPFYSSQIPIANKNYEITGTYPVNFRTDPRKSDSMKINITDDIVGDVITFNTMNVTFISLQSEYLPCEDNTIAVAAMSIFLREFGAINIKAAFANKTYAKEKNYTYATCENNPRNTVIMIKDGDETSIIKTKNNCYELTYKNCEILKVTEKFQVLILENYMSYFIKKE